MNCPTCTREMKKHWFYYYCPTEHSMEDAEFWYTCSLIAGKIAKDFYLDDVCTDEIADIIEKGFKGLIELESCT